MDYNWEIARIIFYLLLVIGLIYFTSFLFKRKITGSRQGKYISILERCYISSKMSMTLVRVNNKVLLIGISPSRIELLAEWELREFESVAPEKGWDFRDYIQAFINKGSDKSKSGLTQDENGEKPDRRDDHAF